MHPGSDCDDEDDGTMGDTCATGGTGSCAGTVRQQGATDRGLMGLT